MTFLRGDAAPPRKEPPSAQEPHERPAERQDSGIRALAAVARHYQLDWSLQRLTHLYGKDREPDGKEIVRIARAEDVNGDGFSDLLWQDATTGDVKATEFAANGSMTTVALGAPASTFHLVASTGGG